MTAEDTNQPKPEIRSDDDWKQRVKAEDAALDRQSQQGHQEQDEPSRTETSSGPTNAQGRAGEAKPSAEAAESQPFFPPDINMIVGMLSTQAMVALGVIPNPVTGQAEPHIELARHFIDMLDVLEDKTKGNLEPNEASLLRSTLHQLRMVYVEKTK